MNNTKKDTQRKAKLGVLGEACALAILVELGYVVKNINSECKNFPFADLYAEKDDKKLVISVKTRNKYRQSSGRKTINEEYNLLYDNKEKHARQAEREYSAKAYWMAVQVHIEAQKYSIYMGSLEELKNKGWKGIKFDRDSGKCKAGNTLLENSALPPAFDDLSNQR